MREMKDSGIEWIGKIPKSWTVKPIRADFAEMTRKNKDKKLHKALKFTYGNIVAKENFETDDEYVANTISNYTIVNPGTIMLNGLNLNFDFVSQRIGLVKDVGAITSAYIAFKPINNLVASEFAMYVFKAYDNCKAFHNMGGGVRKILNFSELGKQYFFYPNLNEQQRIANYLDQKCSEIDAITKDIQTQIDTLEQYKRSVITEAVTKGLDPDAEMKDSGIEWIGKTPATWTTIKIGKLFSMRNERNSLPMEEVQLLSLYTGVGVFPHGEREERGNKAVTVEGYKVVHKNDIVVNIILAWMGAIGISEYDGVTSPAYDIYIPDVKKAVPHYYHYIFRTPGIAGECYKYGRGIMMMRWRTYSQEFKQISVPYPPLDQQQQIADYLDDKCNEINNLIELKQQQLSTLSDYKKSLIYEYVTGKKEVPAE